MLRQAGNIGSTYVFDLYQPYCPACVGDRNGPMHEALRCLNVGEVKVGDKHAYATCLLNYAHSGPCRIGGHGGQELLDPAPGRCEQCGTTNGMNKKSCAMCRAHLWDKPVCGSRVVYLRTHEADEDSDLLDEEHDDRDEHELLQEAWPPVFVHK